MREKITDVFYNNGHFEVLVYFKGTKIFLEVSLSSFVEDFFNSFNASEPIILDWLKSNVFSKFSSILSATTCLDELFNLITSLFLATAFKQQIVTIVPNNNFFISLFYLKLFTNLLLILRRIVCWYYFLILYL